ncbi:MAG: hypothetical protein A3G05_01910 [Candidatus Zambryskibacteria bacterium RIFCSPLOWO2_12_FULL_45_14]|uniref:Fibronectin type-III domain-containing protein n=2 Tax=Candidatus Zambryskiibacteriota TaxID=1817925 RepID=A0A1G2UKW6_9BACT|nr:MAG: hypothetical protein A3H60_02935 [Candidatus Zambryskibacteria bacterium RIFCSPLOWO2_02_FULL_44_12b]OHB14106.1 MAG: hypothetical protein A3G05_01910 [Candidatus Zambryskibacteria bacterium RIFCSPLOWO2_12_FULL_45_14]
MKRKLLASLTSLVVAGSMLVPMIGSAQSTTTTAQINSLTALIQQIQALQAQIDALKASQTTLQAQISTEFIAFVTSLSLGSRGDAVAALQALLAANPNIYPESLITGYFGKATERALRRLQKENGLEQVGHVGPKTRALLNRLLKDNPIAFEDDDDDNATSTNRKRGESRRLCAAVPPGHLIAPGWLKKHDGVRPIVPECQTLPKGIAQKGDDWKAGSTTPDTVAPSIMNLSATTTASTTASITWSTNEKATSTLWYSITTPLNTATATKIEKSTWQTSHAYNLSGLIASTTYYYLVRVSDKWNNTTTSAEQSFTTSNN